jgi:hypothetical protein
MAPLSRRAPGKEEEAMELDAGFYGKFPFFVEFLNKDPLLKAVSKNRRIMIYLKKHGEQSAAYFRKALTTGNEPRIVPSELSGASGFTSNNSVTTRRIQINAPILRGHHWSKVCENGFAQLPATHEIRRKHPKPEFNSVVWEEIITTTLLHELVHFANHDAGVFPDRSVERGIEFEKDARLNTPAVPFSEIEDFRLWGAHNTIDNPLFPITMKRI